MREAGLADSEAVDYLRAPDGLRARLRRRPTLADARGVLEAGDYALVFADPLYKLHRGDSNEERQAVDLMRQPRRAGARATASRLMLPVHLP